MTKLVWKTIAITLASVLGACLLIFGALALFSPITLAKFFEQTGSEKLALHFYEKQYEKSKDIEDLARLVLIIDDNENSSKSETYLRKLVNHSDFNKLCAEQDLSVNAVSSVEYYNGRLVTVLMNNGKFDMAISVCKEFVSEYGYTESNPYTVVVLRFGEQLNSDQKQAVKTELNSLLVSLQIEQERQRIQYDLTLLED